MKLAYVESELQKCQVKFDELDTLLMKMKIPQSVRSIIAQCSGILGEIQKNILAESKSQ